MHNRRIFATIDNFQMNGHSDFRIPDYLCAHRDQFPKVHQLSMFFRRSSGKTKNRSTYWIMPQSVRPLVCSSGRREARLIIAGALCEGMSHVTICRRRF